MKTLDKIVREKILPNFSGFEYHKNIMFKAPISEVLSGFCFEKIKDHIYLWQFFQPTFVPTKHIYFTFGERLGTNKKRYPIDQLNIESTVEVLNKEISTKLFFVESLCKASEFYNFFVHGNNSFEKFQDLVFTSCYLDNSECSSMLNELIKIIETSDNVDAEWMKELLKNSKQLYYSNNVQRKLLFAEWRNFTLNELGLHKWAE
jgi:hypothetical protein